MKDVLMGYYMPIILFKGMIFFICLRREKLLHGINSEIFFLNLSFEVIKKHLRTSGPSDLHIVKMYSILSSSFLLLYYFIIIIILYLQFEVTNDDVTNVILMVNIIF